MIEFELKTCIRSFHRHFYALKTRLLALKMLARCLILLCFFILYPRFYVIKSVYANSECRFLQPLFQAAYGDVPLPYAVAGDAVQTAQEEIADVDGLGLGVAAGEIAGGGDGVEQGL